MIKYRRNIFKRFLAVILTIVLVAGSFFAIPAKQVEAGIGAKIAGVVVHGAKRGLVMVCNHAADSGTELGELLGKLGNMLKSPEEKRADKIIDMCEEILKDLEVIEEELTYIEKQNKDMELKLDQIAISDIADVMDDFNVRYHTIWSEYEALLVAAINYGENPTQENYNALKLQYDTIEKFYKNESLENKDSTTISFNFTNDILAYLRVVSPYEPASTYQEPDQWKDRFKNGAVDNTYLTAVKNYYTDATASQSWMYEAMTNGLNYAIIPMCYYMQVFQLYTVMKVNAINVDTSMTWEERADKIALAWSELEKGSNYVVNAINQMASICGNVTTDCMRPYDTQPTRVTMDYEESREVGTHQLGHGQEVYTATASKTKDTLAYSILKLRDGSTYAVYSDGGINPTFTLGDMVMVTDKWVATNHNPTGDYYNLLHGKDNWAAFNLIAGPEELSEITEYGSYDLASNNLAEYLVKIEKMSPVFANYENTDPFYGVTRTYDNYDALNQTGDANVDFSDLKSVQRSDLGASRKDLDLEDDILEEGIDDRTAGFIMKKDSDKDVPLEFRVLKDEGADVRIVNNDKLDENGDPTVIFPDDNGNYTIPAGDCIDVRVKLDDGKEISSAYLYGENQAGRLREVDDFATVDDIGDIEDFLEVSDDGYYVLSTFPMPFRNTTLQIVTKNIEEECMAVLEDDGQKAKLQFTGTPGIDRKSFTAESTVSVNVWPEEGILAEGIEVTDVSGNPLSDIEVTEDKDRESTLPDGVKVYTFTMTKEMVESMGTKEVKISPKLAEGHTVTLTECEHGQLVFADSDGQTIESAGMSRTFYSGERVYVKGVPSDADSYYCENITVKKENGADVLVKSGNDANFFKMPEGDVRVLAEFGKRDGYEVQSVIENKNGAGGTVKLDNQTSALAEYNSGETVTVSVIPEEGSAMESYSVTTVSGDEVESQCSSITAQDRIQKITFKMPRKNVTVKVVFNKCSVYTGTLTVDQGLKGTIIEKAGAQEAGNEILSDVVQGSASFAARTSFKYELKVEAVEEGSSPVVTYICGNTESALSGQETGGQYTYTISDITGDFKIKVDNTKEPQKETFMIPDYDTLCFYADRINKEYENAEEGSTEGVYRNADYVVTADITSSGNTFYPIKDFYGTFDGGGHKIEGLYVIQSFCFINKLGGTIKNLELSNFKSPGNVGDGAGAFARTMLSGSMITDCKLSGGSEIPSGQAGGIAHTVESGAVIRNCGVDTSVRISCANQYAEYNYVGGIAYCNNGSIENCYFAGQLDIGSYAGGYRGNILGGICAEGSEGIIWNCYVKDGFVYDWVFQTAQQGSRANTVYDIGNCDSISCSYISVETQQKLNSVKKQDEQKGITYSSNSSVDYTKTVSQMKSSGFADVLNENITDTEQHTAWKQNDTINDGYPYLEVSGSSEPMKTYTAKIGTVEEGAELVIWDELHNQNVNELSGIPAGNRVNLTGSTTFRKVQIEVQDTTSGKTIVKTECVPDENGKIATSFRMPSGNVEITASKGSVHVGKIPVDAEVLPAFRAEASLQNKAGEVITEAKLTDTVYLKVDEIEDGYGVGRILLKSNFEYEPFQPIEDPGAIRQEDGRYEVTLDDITELLKGKVTICAIMQESSYNIAATVSPENSGSIECVQNASYKDAVNYTVTPNEGYYCSSLLLCGANGDVLQTLSLADGKGSFIMPAQDVNIKATFRKATYEIATKDSDDMKLTVSDSSGNSISYASEGDVVTVHYLKDAWSADENIFVYQAGETNPVAQWVAQGEADSEDNPLTFVMPESAVEIVASQMEGSDYSISKIIEGSGTIEIRDLATDSKNSAKQGEKIIVAAFADRGSSVDQDNTKVYDSQNNIIDVHANIEENYAVFSMPAENITVKGVFVQNNYSITVNEPSEGTISVTDENGTAIDLNAVHYDDKLKIKVVGLNVSSVNYRKTDGENSPVVNIPLDENGEAVFYMPDMNITISEGYQMDQDENGNYQISDFSDLQEAAVIVQDNPGADFILTNNIIGSGESLTAQIGTAENPYTGTFDGQGYYIYKFNIENQAGDAAFFGTIGEGGTVKRLGIFFQNAKGNRAAGIAAVNNGLVDECISGSNVVGSYTDRETGERHDLSETNTVITGEEMAGGVVIENNGVIRNTRNYAKTNASSADGIAGGIAAINRGTIENCFNRGNLKAGESAARTARSSGGIAGGIAGINEAGAQINIAYCSSAALEGNQAGAIYGKNTGAISNTYYLDELSNATDQGTKMTVKEMKNDTFTSTLNRLAEGNGDLRGWIRDEDKNGGYPRISSSMIVTKELYAEDIGLSVTGTMHRNAVLNFKHIDSSDAVYKAFEKYAKDNGMQVQFAVDPGLYYGKIREYAEYEGLLNCRMDVSKRDGKNIKVLVYQDGKVKEVELNKQMLASIKVSELPQFAVVSGKTAADNGTGSDHSNSVINKVVNSIKTGDGSNVFMWAVLLIAAALGIGIVIKVRRKKG